METGFFFLLAFCMFVGCKSSTPTDSTGNNNNNTPDTATHIGWSAANTSTLGGGNTATFIVGDGSDLYIMSQSGLYYSNDTGKTLQERDHGLSFGQGQTALFKQDNYLYAGLEGFGNFRSSDKGVTWEDITHGHTSGFFFPYSNALYIGTAGGTIPAMRSTDHGDTWVSVSAGLVQYWGNDFIALGNILYISPSLFGDWFSSTDGATTWKSYTGPLKQILANYEFLSTVTTQNGTILIGRESQPPDPVSVYGAPSGTDNWTPHNSGLPASGIVSMAISGKNIFAAGQGLFWSSDNGNTWTDITSNGAGYANYYTAVGISNGVLLAGGAYTGNNGMLVRRPLSDFN